MTARREIQLLGQMLRQARARKGLSTRELSARSGVHNATITVLERAQIDQPRPDKLVRLARALGLDTKDVLTLAGYEPTDRLPNLKVYLRSTTKLPNEAIQELTRYFDYLHERYGVSDAGPQAGEDEAP